MSLRSSEIKQDKVTISLRARSKSSSLEYILDRKSMLAELPNPIEPARLSAHRAKLLL
jgi:hypothetical protein